MDNISPEDLQKVAAQAMEYANTKIGKLSDLKESPDFIRWGDRNKGFIDGARAQYRPNGQKTPDAWAWGFASGLVFAIIILLITKQ